MFNFSDRYLSFNETNEEYYTRQFLDSLPWDTLLSQGIDLQELMEQIQETYGPSLTDNPTFKGDVFNWMCIGEFADYIRSKGYHVLEEVTVQYILGGKKYDFNS